jgi:CheY-like chemotaxis protein
MIAVAIVTEQPSTGLGPRRVLLVEDDVDTREFVAEALRDSGHDVEEATDGREALAAILRESPRLLITDCNMPRMSGNELVEILARDERLCSIPVIVVSARSQPPLPANVLAFLHKPFTMKQLGAAVRDSLSPRLPVSPKPSVG